MSKIGAQIFDVIVIGGGPAGSLTALYLLKMRPELAGRIALFESKPFYRDKICAGAVLGRVVSRLEVDLGVSLDSVPHVEVGSSSIRFRDLESTTVQPGFARVFRRRFLDTYLLKCAEKRGTLVFTETPVIGANASPSGVTVDTTKGKAAASALICADGVNGKTRDFLGAGAGSGKDYLLQVDITGADAPKTLTFDFSPLTYDIKGYVWIFPSTDLNGEGFSINAGISGGTRGNITLLKRAFTETAGRMLDTTLREEDLKFNPYPERKFSFRGRNHLPRVLFVGDHLGVTPLTGEGIGICLDSAKVAARTLLAGFDSGDYSFKGFTRQLARSDFFPMWLLENIGSHLWMDEKKFPWFLLLTGARNRSEAGCLVSRYSKAHAGKVEPSWGFFFRSLMSSSPSAALLSEGFRTGFKNLAG